MGAVWAVVMVVLLATTGIVAARAMRYERGVQPPPQRALVAAPGRTTHLQLVATGVVDDAFVLDGLVVDEDSELGPEGWPIALRLGRPGSPWLAERVAALVARWVATDKVIECAITGAGPRRRVAVTDGASILYSGVGAVDPQGPSALG